MKMGIRIGLVSAFLGLAACGKVGQTEINFSLSNNNNRDITINFNGENRTFNVANVIVIFDNIHYKAGAEEFDLFDVKTPIRFDDAATVKLGPFDSEALTFDQLDLELGIADAAAAADAGEENVLDRTFHIEGTIDADGDGVVETGIVVYAPAEQEVEFEQSITVNEDALTTLNVQIDLTSLLATVDFALAENVGGELSLTEDNAINQTPVVSGNVPVAFTFLP